MGAYAFLDPHLEGMQKNLISTGTRDLSVWQLSLETTFMHLAWYV